MATSTNFCIQICLCSFLLFASIEAIEVTTPPIKPELMAPVCPINSASGKDTPSKEPNLGECKLYKCSSCCREETAKELMANPLRRVGRVDFAQCGDLTEACSEETTYMECFYQCSPNLFPWMDARTRRVQKLPICASFCEAWFQKCQMDRTCVAGDGNWQTLNPVKDENNKTVLTCQAGVSCRNYSEVYGTAEKMCNTIWGDLFEYTADDKPCLHPYDPRQDAAMIRDMNSNYQVEDCYPEAIPYTDPGLIVGIVLGVLAGLCIIGAGIAYFMRRKKGKGSSSPKPVAVAASEEMSTRVPQPVPDSAVDGHSDSDHE